MANPQAPKLYVYVMDDARKEIAVSAFPMDSPEFQNNHMILKEVDHHRSSAQTSARILRNVLSATGIPVMLE